MVSTPKQRFSPEEKVLVLAEQAGLALDKARARAVALVLEEWILAADRLSIRMSSAEYSTHAPIIGFTQAPAAKGDSHEV
jgi:hypothetical protein